MPAPTYDELVERLTGAVAEIEALHGALEGATARIARLEDELRRTQRAVEEQVILDDEPRSAPSIPTWGDRPPDFYPESRDSSGGGIIDPSAKNDMLISTDGSTWSLLSGPDADYKVLQRKSDGNVGWDWVRAH